MSESFDALQAQKDAMVQRQANAAQQAWMRSLMCEAHKEYVIPACDCPGCAHASGVVPPAPSGAPELTVVDVDKLWRGTFDRDDWTHIVAFANAVLSRFGSGVAAPAPSAPQPEKEPKP